MREIGIIFFLLIVLSFCFASTDYTIVDSASGVIIPLYLEDSSAYSRIIQARATYSKVPIIVIINPDSGPGVVKDNQYSGWISQLQSSGAIVVGYVYTGYGSRNINVVKGDIDKYKQFYPSLNGIFYDEMNNQQGSESYYQSLLTYSSSKGFSFSVGNPGTHTISSYINLMDVTLIYEDAGLPTLSQYQSYSSYANSKLGMIPLNVPVYSEQWVNDATGIIGWVYVTNDKLDNPWDTLSSHFEKLIETLNKLAVLDSANNGIAGLKNYLIVDLSSGSTSYLDYAPSDLLTNSDYKSSKMVLRKISKGTFTMGAPANEPGRFSNTNSGNESPQHSVTLSKDFYMSVFEVTQGQWNLVNSGSVSGQTNYPIYLITWDSIRGAAWPNNYLPGSNSFVGRLKQKTNLSFDLPTEAQWEYACRAGTTTGLNTPPNGADYSTSNVSIVSARPSILDPIQPVGTKTPNNWGLYDMHGNVAEFVLDWILRDGSAQYYLGASSSTDPVGLGSSASNKVKATRGDVQSDGAMSKIRCGARNLDFAGLDGVTSSRQASDYGPGFRVVVKDVVSDGVGDAIKFCSSLPAGAVWNDGGLNGAYYGTTVTTSYGVIAGNCKWKCRENYTVNSQQTFCVADIKLEYCNGSLPVNALWSKTTNAGQFVQTWNGTIWSPATKNVQHNSSAQDCYWKCDADNNYAHLNGVCVMNARSTPCSVITLIANAVWNDNGNNGFFTQTLVNGVWSPSSGVTSYSENVADDCRWKCKSGFYREGSVCVENTRLADCSLSLTKNVLPENAIWSIEENAGKFTQVIEEGSWFPSSKKAFYAEDANECAYKCKEQSRGCLTNPEKYCGVGVQDCNKGYWGICNKGNSAECTVNQFCSLGECAFCPSGLKNCDGNLLNGCEQDVLSSPYNCGSCGNNCPSGTICNNGSCASVEDDENFCDDFICGVNSSCVEERDNCVCAVGYNDCDSLTSNGCETLGACVPVGCSTNSDCSSGKECKNNTCVSISCSSNSACTSSRICSNGVCVELLCKQNYSKTSHACVCSGVECGGTCNKDRGVCCNNKWNAGVDVCDYDFEEGLDLVNSSKNIVAQELMSKALDSYSLGEVAIAVSYAKAAEVRAEIALANNPVEYVESYEKVLQALDDKDYSKAQSLSVQLSEELSSEPKQNNLFLFGGVIVLIILIILVPWIVFRGKKN